MLHAQCAAGTKTHRCLNSLISTALCPDSDPCYGILGALGDSILQARNILIFAAPTTMVHIRVDENTKQQAAKTLASMGISVSAADQGKGKRLKNADALFKDLGI